MLRRLYLGRNRLRRLPRLTSRSFAHLLVLDVHANALAAVESDALSGLVALERLHLGANRLQQLSTRRLFAESARIRLAHLAHNPWTCDCR